MRVTVRKSAVKDLRRIHDPYKRKIQEAVRRLVDFPNIPQIKRLVRHDPKFRMRVGEYRILFDVQEDEIIVARILHRKESYTK